MWNTGADDRPEPEPDQAGESHVLVEQAWALAAAGLIDDARSVLADAKRMAAPGDPQLQQSWAEFHAATAYVDHACGEYEAATRQSRAALDLYTPSPSNRWYVSTLLWLIDSLQAAGAIHAAR